MRKRMLLTLAITAMLLASLTAVAAAGERREAPMQELNGAPGAVIPGASVQVNATGDKARIRVKTSGLESGHAYTIWSFSFSDPDACVGPCDEGDDFVVNQVAGHIVGNGDRANFGGSIRVENATGAEYHIVVADHGPKDPAQLPEQIKTPGPGVQIGIILP